MPNQIETARIAGAVNVLRPDWPVGSLVTVWAGTPQEREGTVVATALGKHSIAPSSAQMWLV